MAEFNYGINIPQPNTSMFGGGNILQGLATIEQIRGAQAQQALAQQLAPYELQKAQLGIQGMQLQQDATRQGMGFAQAANARAQASEARTVEAATADRRLADALSSGASAEEIFKLLPYASDSMAQKFPQIAQSYISSKLIPVLRGGVIDTEQKKKIVDDAMSVGAVLDPARAKVAQAAIASVPDPVRQNFLPKIFEVANAGYNGNSELALSTLKDYGSGLLKDPKTSALGELVMNAHKNMSGFGDKIPLSAWYAQLKSLSVGMGDPVASDQIDEFSKKFLDISQSEAKTAQEKQKQQKVENLPVAAQKMVDAALNRYEQIGQIGDKAGMLAEKLADIERPTGIGGAIKNWFSVLFGQEKDIQTFTRELKSLSNQQALTEWASVAKGSMSDRDVKVALSTVPSAFGSKEDLMKYLLSYANASKRAAEFQGAKADWISKFGGNGAAKFETDIGGLAVKEGETLRQFQDRITENLVKKSFYGPNAQSTKPDFSSGTVEFSPSAIRLADEILKGSKK